MDTLELFEKENSQNLINGIYYLSEMALSVPLSKGGERGINESFENLYLKLRALEGRVYDDETVRNLPDIRTPLHLPHQVRDRLFLKGGTILYKEWSTRKNSSEKLIKYLSEIKKELIILDLGCGNGWLSNKLSEIEHTSVFAVDINLHELEQAARVFGNKSNLIFAYADIFDEGAYNILSKIKFDIIVLAGVLMYFKDIKLLIDKLFGLLNPNGEIHIMDNIFYNEKNIERGRKNSVEHYKQLEVPEMINLVHHHLLSELYSPLERGKSACLQQAGRTGCVMYKPQVLYNPNKFINKIKRKLKPELSPFYWMKIVR